MLRLLVILNVLSQLVVSAASANSGVCRNLLSLGTLSQIARAASNIKNEPTVRREISTTLQEIGNFTQPLVNPELAIDTGRMRPGYLRDGTLGIGNVFFRSQLAGDYKQSSRLVIAHEYGHAIFDANLAKVFPLHKGIMDLMKRMAPYYYKQEAAAVRTVIDEYASGTLSAIFPRAAEQLHRRHAGNRRSRVESIKPVQDLIAQLHAEFFHNQPRGSEAVDRITDAYNELFADLIATLLADDEYAIAKLLNAPYRAFGPFNPQNSKVSQNAVDVYSVTFPSRQAVGAVFFRNHRKPWTLEYKRTVANAVFQAMVVALVSLQQMFIDAENPAMVGLNPDWRFVMEANYSDVPPRLQELINESFISALRNPQ